MTTQQIVIATSVWVIAIAVVYGHSGYAKIRDCYGMWFTIKESIEKLKNQNKTLLDKFKEIKNLSILYKEDKEKEIQSLQSELQELKGKILDNEKNYSESIEKVSNSINNFLEKIN